MKDLEEDFKVPYFSIELIEYLKKYYDLNALLAQKVRNNDELIGYIRGVQDVINFLSFKTTEKEG